jgi:chromate transporter
VTRDQPVPLSTLAGHWLRIGATGFGGPPAHIALLRELCVQQRRWISESEFEDGVAATNLLPGPASTQLAIYCAWRLRGWPGGLLGGVCFVAPGLVVILVLSALLLSGHPARPVLGAAAGAGAAVPAVAVQAGLSLIPASWRRTGRTRAGRYRWLAYTVAGGVAAATIGASLVAVLLCAGAAETAVHLRRGRPRAALPFLAGPVGLAGTYAALAWVAFKVGALSYGGGFVIVPLMRADAVDRHHWMSAGQFLYAVALGQVTPGPVLHTVAVVGYAAAGTAGGLIAAAVAFAPSFAMVLAGGRHFDRLRANAAVQAFLSGAGPAAIGAILGSAVLLARSIDHLWQIPVLVGAGLWLLPLRRGVVSALLGAGLVGVASVWAGLPIG